MVAECRQQQGEEEAEALVTEQQACAKALYYHVGKEVVMQGPIFPTCRPPPTPFSLSFPLQPCPSTPSFSAVPIPPKLVCDKHVHKQSSS